jgi:endonuclease/exonuclease/phosphatase family metal-dependent hydrolase
MAQTKGPKILMGDFNAEPEEPAIKQLSEKLQDTQTIVNRSREERKSYPAGEKSEEAIDYIFVSREFRVLSASVLRDKTLASDHNPVIAEVELR